MLCDIEEGDNLILTRLTTLSILLRSKISSLQHEPSKLPNRVRIPVTSHQRLEWYLRSVQPSARC